MEIATNKYTLTVVISATVLSLWRLWTFNFAKASKTDFEKWVQPITSTNFGSWRGKMNVFYHITWWRLSELSTILVMSATVHTHTICVVKRGTGNVFKSSNQSIHTEPWNNIKWYTLPETNRKRKIQYINVETPTTNRVSESQTNQSKIIELRWKWKPEKSKPFSITGMP